MSKSRKQVNKRSNLWIILAGLIVAGIAGLIVLLQQPKSAAGYPAEIMFSEAAVKRDSGAFILDVRQPEEWNDYHVPGSTLIPLDQLPSRLSEVPSDREIVVVCRSGNRSATGRDILLRAGFTKVTSLAGGLKEWRAQGYPVISGP